LLTHEFKTLPVLLENPIDESAEMAITFLKEVMILIIKCPPLCYELILEMMAKVLLRKILTMLLENFYGHQGSETIKNLNSVSENVDARWQKILESVYTYSFFFTFQADLRTFYILNKML
jgi:hypothetical protein